MLCFSLGICAACGVLGIGSCSISEVKAWGGSCGKGVVGAGVGARDVKDGFRFMRESVDFLARCDDEGLDRGCIMVAGTTGTSWSLEEELRREASELLEGWE